MTIERMLTGIVKGGAATYVEDVFSTKLYTGNGSTGQTITNNIDLATKGGLVWTKDKETSADGHTLVDNVRGINKYLASQNTNGQNTGTDITSFISTGYTIAHSNGGWNYNARTYVSWTFRKQAKFFDVVTYTGNGSNRTISHSLGVAPGMIIVKRTDTTGDWFVYHSVQASASYYTLLNTGAAQTSDTTVWNAAAPTSSVFSVGTNTGVNANSGTYVAYLFAASSSGGFGASGTDSVVACGSYTGNGSASGPTVTLGWEPQYVLIKNITDAGFEWRVLDSQRGMSGTGNDAVLYPNVTAAQYADAEVLNPTSTGFQITTDNGGFNSSGSTFIYLAIRKGPMKV